MEKRFSSSEKKKLVGHNKKEKKKEKKKYFKNFAGGEDKCVRTGKRGLFEKNLGLL